VRDIAVSGLRAYVVFMKPASLLKGADPMPPMASAAPGLSRPLLVLALAAGVVLAATGTLWAYYGTTVFFEVVRTGWVACF
jgi:hypothetical protein